MTFRLGYTSCGDGPANNGIAMTKAFDAMSRADEYRSEWLNEQIRTQAANDARDLAKPNGRSGGRNHRRPRSWHCSNCGCRNYDTAWCSKCLMVRLP